MTVIGRDGVGGIIGYAASDYNINHKDYQKSFDRDRNINDVAIKTPYNVFGRMAVGGFCGELHGSNLGFVNVNYDIDKTENRPIEVNGIAYTGGLAGLYEARYVNKNTSK